MWFEAGATKFEFADAVTLAIVQSFLMGFAESKRYNDFVNPGSQVPTQHRGLERLGEGPVGVCALQQLLSDQLLKQGLEALF